MSSFLPRRLRTSWRPGRIARGGAEHRVRPVGLFSSPRVDVQSVDPWLNSWPFAHTLFGDPVSSTALPSFSRDRSWYHDPSDFRRHHREVIAVVPQDLIEASLSLGATRWQVIRKVVLPTSRIGLFGAAFLRSRVPR